MPPTDPTPEQERLDNKDPQVAKQWRDAGYGHGEDTNPQSERMRGLAPDQQQENGYDD